MPPKPTSLPEWKVEEATKAKSGRVQEARILAAAIKRREDLAKDTEPKPDVETASSSPSTKEIADAAEKYKDAVNLATTCFEGLEGDHKRLE